MNSGQAFAPDPTGGAYSAPSYLLAGGEGLDAPSQRNQLPALALRPSSFNPVGLVIPLAP